MDSLVDVVVLTDSHGQVTFANRSAEDRLQSGLLQRDHEAPFDSRIRNLRWDQTVRGDTSRHVAMVRLGEGDLLDSRGQTRRFRFRVSSLIDGSSLWLILNLHDRDRMEGAGHDDFDGELLHAQKLDSLGRLAGGIAHEFNNSLAAIKTYTHLLQREGSPKSLEYASQVSDVIDSAVEFTRSLLSLAKKTKFESRSCDLNSQIRSVLPLLARVLGEGVTIETSLAPDLPRAWFDSCALMQIELNLGFNAMHAMSEGGRLSIRSGLLEVEDGDPRLGGRRGPQVFVTLRVADNGEGMDTEVLRRAFDPFFTTRSAGRGTGLGLSIARGIVTQSHGFIDVSSRHGYGTSFLVGLLPADCAPEALDIRSESERAEVRKSSEGKILLLEDEATVREPMCQLLTEAGYEVLGIENGESIREISYEDLRSLDLVISDVVMPGIDGVECVARLRKRTPDLPAILMTGYSPEGVAGDRDPGDPLLSKPFEPADLLELVAARCVPRD